MPIFITIVHQFQRISQFPPRTKTIRLPLLTSLNGHIWFPKIKEVNIESTLSKFHFEEPKLTAPPNWQLLNYTELIENTFSVIERLMNTHSVSLQWLRIIFHDSTAKWLALASEMGLKCWMSIPSRNFKSQSVFLSSDSMVPNVLERNWSTSPNSKTQLPIAQLQAQRAHNGSTSFVILSYWNHEVNCQCIIS